ncbi:MAG: hypothetical protein Greene07144_919 [Parcubacteria group bacterium Greene0714_4]|nr:MAG: hypothetical protein Greene07144_919 [Parcubacteria group bacterium Greene0714_4]
MCSVQNTDAWLLIAEVVKLANTQRSERCGRKSLWVQVPPSAPKLAKSVPKVAQPFAIANGSTDLKPD